MIWKGDENYNQGMRDGISLLMHKLQEYIDSSHDNVTAAEASAFLKDYIKWLRLNKGTGG